MRGLLILIKSYEKHICQKWIFNPLLVPWRLKRARKSWNWPYFKSRFCIKSKSKSLAISVSYRMIYNLNNSQVWLIYLKNWRSYAKPAKQVQIALFLYTHFFWRSFWGIRYAPHMTRKKIFLSETCSEFIFRKSQWMPVFKSYRFFVDVRKSGRGGKFYPPPARDRVKFSYRYLKDAGFLLLLLTLFRTG